MGSLWSKYCVSICFRDHYRQELKNYSILIHNQNDVYKNPPLLFMYMLTFSSNFDGTLYVHIAYKYSIYTLTFLRSPVYVESWQEMDPVEYFIFSCYVVSLQSVPSQIKTSQEILSAIKLVYCQDERRWIKTFLGFSKK